VYIVGFKECRIFYEYKKLRYQWAVS